MGLTPIPFVFMGFISLAKWLRIDLGYVEVKFGKGRLDV